MVGFSNQRNKKIDETFEKIEKWAISFDERTNAIEKEIKEFNEKIMKLKEEMTKDRKAINLIIKNLKIK